MTDVPGALVLDLYPKLLVLYCILLNTGRENNIFRDTEKMFSCIQSVFRIAEYETNRYTYEKKIHFPAFQVLRNTEEAPCCYFSKTAS